MKPDAFRLFDALDATWPAAAFDDAAAPGWVLRRGEGGGKRVSCATVARAGALPEVGEAEAAMAAMGQGALFMLRPGEAALDAVLAARGCQVVDPTVIYLAEAEALAALPLKKGVKSVQVRTRLALMDEIWDAGGIGPARRAVMARCAGPSAVLMARTDAATAGAAHVAVDGDVAMLHAAEVRATARRQGAGRGLLVGAARFALEHGAPWLALAVTEANSGARALYEAAGMEEAARYHYRAAGG